jgi:hypothetical protein
MRKKRDNIPNNEQSDSALKNEREMQNKNRMRGGVINKYY